MKRDRIVESDGLILTYFDGRHTLADAEEALTELLFIKTGQNQIFEIVVNEGYIQLDFRNYTAAGCI